MIDLDGRVKKQLGYILNRLSVYLGFIGLDNWRLKENVLWLVVISSDIWVWGLLLVKGGGKCLEHDFLLWGHTRIVIWMVEWIPRDLDILSYQVLYGWGINWWAVTTIHRIYAFSYCMQMYSVCLKIPLKVWTLPNSKSSTVKEVNSESVLSSNSNLDS